MFQSSPGTEAGSYEVQTAAQEREIVFQSSPGTEAGSYLPIPVFVFRHPGFNPLPAQKPGATKTDGSQRVQCRVSILSRHRSRELQKIEFTCVDSWHVSILSRHRSRELLTTLDGSLAGESFQSSPGTEAGSYGCPSILPRPLLQFQSSPGTEAGSYAWAIRFQV